MHHIVSDGWSMGVLMRELARCTPRIARASRSRCRRCRAVRGLRGLAAPLAARATVLQQQLAYWRDAAGGRARAAGAADGSPAARACATTAARACVRARRGARRRRLEALGRRARRDAVHDAAGGVRRAAVAPIAARTTSSSARRSPTARRAEIEALIGFFVNTLALRARLSRRRRRSSALLERVRRERSRAYAHQDVPFEQLVEAVHPPRSLSHTPLFQVMFVCRTRRAQRRRCAGAGAAEHGAGRRDGGRREVRSDAGR